MRERAEANDMFNIIPSLRVEPAAEVLPMKVMRD